MRIQNEKLTATLDKISAWKDDHNQLVIDLMQPSKGLRMSDLYACTVLNRSLSLMRGFRSLVETRNYTCAAPLVRLQLDNTIRFGALGLAPDHHQFVLNVFNGVPVRKQKDCDGKPMTDAYLVEKIMDIHPEFAWVKQLYEQTSGYIHLSERHFFDTFGENPPIPGEHRVNFRALISEADVFVQDDNYQELANAFNITTDLLLALVTKLATSKKNGPPAETV